MEISRDILEDLFMRFPVKTLMRLNCVSKEWNNFISDDSFRRCYMSQEKIKCDAPSGFICHGNILDTPLAHNFYKLYYHGANKFLYISETYVEKEELKYLNYLCKIGFVMAASKGLLLLSHNPESFKVYDLVSKKYVILPRNHDVRKFVSLGFNCEEKSIKHDIYNHRCLCYKVVCVPLEDEAPICSSYNVEIYSSETRTWKKSVMKAKKKFSMRPRYIAKVIGGVFYWHEPDFARIIAYDSDDPNGRTVLIECPRTSNNFLISESLKKTFEGTKDGSLQFIQMNEMKISVWIMSRKDGGSYMDEDKVNANMWNLAHSVSLWDISVVGYLQEQHESRIIGVDPVDVHVIYFEIAKQIYAYNYYEGKFLFKFFQKIALHPHVFVHFKWPTFPCL